MSSTQQPPAPDAEALRHEMSAVRRELSDDIDDVAENAKELADWRHYVRKYPYACVGIALAVGFVIVPQKVAVMSPTAKQLEKLAKRDHLVVKPSATAGPASPGWKSNALGFVSNLVLRSAVTYAGQQAGKLFGQQATEEQPMETSSYT